MKKKLEDLKTKLKANCKDAHFADILISDLLSAYGQLNHQPTIVHYAIDDIEDSKKGETFEINIMKDGTAILHLYGGYTVVASPRIVSLNKAIRDIMELLDSEDPDDINTASALYTVITAPSFAMTDDYITYKLAADILEWENKLTDEMLNVDLQEEDPEADIAFKKSIEATELMTEALNNEGISAD